MSNFDFFNASGSLDLHVTSVHNAAGTAGLALSYAEGDNVNPFNFKWTLNKDTGIAELALSSRNLYLCDIPGTGYSISSREYERITGIDLTPDEETPENPDDEESPETPPEEEPGTDNPDEEVTDPDQQPEGEGDENQEEEGGNENTNPPETEPSEDTDTEIVA